MNSPLQSSAYNYLLDRQPASAPGGGGRGAGGWRAEGRGAARRPQPGPTKPSSAAATGRAGLDHGAADGQGGRGLGAQHHWGSGQDYSDDCRRPGGLLRPAYATVRNSY